MSDIALKSGFSNNRIRHPYCKLCPDEHLHVCDCKHHHNLHIFTGICVVKGCKCECYSQKQQVLAVVAS